MSLTTIYFDLDGTLFDYERSSFESLSKVISCFNFPASPETVYSEYSKINLELWELREKNLIDLETLRHERFSRLMKKFQWNSVEPKVMDDLYLDYLSKSALIYPDVIEALLLLLPHYFLGVITNGISFVQKHRIRVSGISDYFKDIIISEDVGFAKPDPAIFKLAIERSHAEPESFLYVGDSLTSDYQGAIGSGVFFCWVDRKHSGIIPDRAYFVAKNLHELIIKLKQI